MEPQKILESLYEEYDSVYSALKGVSPDDPKFIKLIDALTKIGALIRDFTKLLGIEDEKEDLAKLLAELREVKEEMRVVKERLQVIKHE